MNATVGFAYGVAAAAAARAAALASHWPGEGKLLRTVRGRQGLEGRYAAWASSGRDLRRPLLWMHASSVGEGLQARPVLELLRQSQPDVQIVYSHFSSSAEPFAQALRERGVVDFADYLPWDTAGATGAALDALTPRALVFSKLDIWPILVDEAASRGTRVGLVSGTLTAASGRHSRLGLAILGDAYAQLDAVGAIDSDDAVRLRAVGVRPHALTVTGDTRYDQVWAHARQVDPQSALLAPWRTAPQPTVVAGSTWPADERVLLAAWLRVRERIPTARLVLAPHEPTAEHLSAVERWAASHGVPVTRLGRALESGSPTEIVLVDRVGVLADLYAAGEIAFVGGGFHSAGLHSVLEPAALGVPVLFGPDYRSSRDARILLAGEAGVTITDAATLAERLVAWLASDVTRRSIGARARAVVEHGLGAAARSVELVRPLL